MPPSRPESLPLAKTLPNRPSDIHITSTSCPQFGHDLLTTFGFLLAVQATARLAIRTKNNRNPHISLGTQPQGVREKRRRDANHQSNVVILRGSWGQRGNWQKVEIVASYCTVEIDAHRTSCERKMPKQTFLKIKYVTFCCCSILYCIVLGAIEILWK